MKDKFGPLATDENGVPILMRETAIFNWLKTRWATKKAAGTDMVLAAASLPANQHVFGDAEGSSTEDESEPANEGLTVSELKTLLSARQLSHSRTKASSH